jgi:hypothetical protein
MRLTTVLLKPQALIVVYGHLVARFLKKYADSVFAFLDFPCLDQIASWDSVERSVRGVEQPCFLVEAGSLALVTS